MQFGGQLSAFASHNDTLILAGSLSTDGTTAGSAVSLLESDGAQLIPLSMKIDHRISSTGLYFGAYDTGDDRNLTIYGGHFSATGSNGSTIQNVAILNGTEETISGLPSGIDSNSTIASMLVYNNTLYAGGTLTGKIGDETLSGFVIYDLSNNKFAS